MKNCLAVCCLLVLAAPGMAQVDAEPSILKALEQVTSIIRMYDEAAASDESEAAADRTPEMFDELETRWEAARPRVSELDADRVESMDELVAVLHWWNRVLVISSECREEGGDGQLGPQDHCQVQQQEVRDRFAKVSPAVVARLLPDNETCQAGPPTAVLDNWSSSSCAASIGSNAMLQMAADLFTTGLLRRLRA